MIVSEYNVIFACHTVLVGVCKKLIGRHFGGGVLCFSLWEGNMVRQQSNGENLNFTRFCSPVWWRTGTYCVFGFAPSALGYAIRGASYLFVSPSSEVYLPCACEFMCVGPLEADDRSYAAVPNGVHRRFPTLNDRQVGPGITVRK